MNRIKELRLAQGIKQDALAQMLNVSRAAMSGYETGKYEADLSTYIAMANIFDVSVDYLIGSSDETAATGAVRIPVLGSIPAGIPMEAIEDIIDWEDIPKELCTGGRQYFGLHVKGDSMSPDIIPGDTVILRKDSTCETGDICAVYVNGYDATLKEVRLDELYQSLTLLPHNTNYPPRTFSREEIESTPVTIAGVVVELRRKMKK